jgi:hypothetical protein
MVQPVQANTFISFEQVLSDKPHCTLVIKPVACKKILHAQQSLMSRYPIESTYHPTPGDVLDPKLKLASLIRNNDVRTDTPALHDHSIIVQGMKEKKHILFAYQAKFVAGHLGSIITQKKGKIANSILLTHNRMDLVLISCIE